MAPRTFGAGPSGFVLTLKSHTSAGLRSNSASSDSDTEPCTTGSRHRMSGRSNACGWESRMYNAHAQEQTQPGAQDHGASDNPTGSSDVRGRWRACSGVEYVVATLLQARTPRASHHR